LTSLQIFRNNSEHHRYKERKIGSDYKISVFSDGPPYTVADTFQHFEQTAVH